MKPIVQQLTVKFANLFQTVVTKLLQHFK